MAAGIAAMAIPTFAPTESPAWVFAGTDDFVEEGEVEEEEGGVVLELVELVGVVETPVLLEVCDTDTVAELEVEDDEESDVEAEDLTAHNLKIIRASQDPHLVGKEYTPAVATKIPAP